MEIKFIWIFFVASCLMQGLAQDNDVTDIPSEIEARIEDVIEGSGNDGIEEKHDITELPIIPQIEPVMASVGSVDEEQMRENESRSKIGEDEKESNYSSTGVKLEDNEILSNTNPPIIDEEKQEENLSQEIPCPQPCLCSIEGEENSLVVNCAGYSLTEFPSPIDTRTTTLNLNNNKLTEIPRDISTLKNLKVLNANDNSIMELAAGSISELPELITLKLANNRLIEYPQDLKNSISLNKLEELDLGGNDIRTTLIPQLFSSLKSLRKVTLPSTTSDLVDDLCGSFKTSLETVCTESCKKQSFDCPDVTNLLDTALPGMISFDNSEETNLIKTTKQEPTASELTTPQTTTVLTTTKLPESNSSTTEFSLRAAVNEEPVSHKPLNILVEAPKDTHDNQPEVKIGAKTEETTKTAGGVDKSVIGIVIASMIVVVAVIAIKKNWSSIKKKFGSGPRPNDRTPTTTNGTTPEEVPLQEKTNDKSPV